MKIAVMGTGMVGRTVGGKLAELGHEVTIGTRDPEALLARTEIGPMVQKTFADWHARHASIPVLIDISVPLDFSHGMPPSLFVCNTDSLGEQIQRAFPATKVVKTLNTVWGALGTGMLNIAVVT